MLDTVDPLPPCPDRPRGHQIDLVIPEDQTGNVLQACRRCGVARLIPLVSPLRPLDDLTADEIARRINAPVSSEIEPRPW